MIDFLKIRRLAFALLFLIPFSFTLHGCLSTSGYDRKIAGCSEPVVIGHLDIRKKKTYVENTWKTLKTFERSATDAAKREKPGLQGTLSREMAAYFEYFVEPILKDDKAVGHLETKLDVAKVHLLSGIVFAHLGETSPARKLLKRFDERYGNDPSFLSATLDYETTGFGSLAEGRNALAKRFQSTH